MSDRLARTFGGFDRTRAELPEWEPEGELEYPDGAETEAWDAPDALFPMTRHGYDPVAVDRRIDELERELSEMHAHQHAEDAVSAEIERIGEQTTAILLAAHDEAQKLKREAQEQADRCLADAAANAVKMTAEAKHKLASLDTETDTVWRERMRLLEDAKGVAGALTTLVEEAMARFPGESDKATVAVAPVDAASPTG